MKDEKKTKDELITELIGLRQRITDLRASEIQRKQTEEALRREKNRILVKESSLGVSIIGRDGHYRYINPKFVEIFGYTLEDIPTGREWFAKAYPDQEYRNQVISTWINDLKESKCGESRPRTFIVTCKDGSERVIYFRPVTMETGEHFVIYEDITERKRTEEELEEYRRHFQTLFQVMVDPVVIVDGKGEFLEVTNGVQQITGFKKEELLGKNFLKTNVVTAKSKAILIKNLAKRMLGMKIAPYEVEVLTKDGKKIPYEVNAAKIKYLGKPAVMAVFRDLTERKNAEQKIRKARDDYLATTNLTGDIIVKVDRKGRWILLNDGACEFWGKSRKELMGSAFANYLHPDDQEKTTAAVKEIETKKIVKGWVNRQKTPKGWRTVEWNGATIFDEQGRYIGFQATGRDITELKRAEEALQESEGKLNAMLQSIGDHMSMMDKDLNIIWANEIAKKVFGNDIIGKKCYEVYHKRKEPCEPYPCLTLKAFQDEKVHEHDTQVIDKDGKIIYFHCTAKVTLRDKDGRATAVMEISRNITELKRSQETLVQERDLLQALIDNIPDSIYFKDDKNRFIRVNKARADLSGTTPESMIGKTDFDFFPREQAKEFFADDSRVMKSNRPLVSKIEKITHADGTEHWVSVAKIPRHNEKGKVIGTMGISRDITTHKQQEKHLAYIATHDALTGFANRALFSDHLTLALARAQRNRQKFPIMLLDLDNFKDVNDRLGHSGGDKLLQAAGDRLNGILRKIDTIARMGGDEFLLLLPEITKTEDIDVVAQKILAAFQRPFLLGDHEVSTTTSIGIAIYPRDGKDADSLIKNADIAMYYAKEKGRNNYQYYTAIMEGKTAG